MTIPDELQRLLDREKLGKMWVDVTVPASASPKVRVLPNVERGPEMYVLDIRRNDEHGKLMVYCDNGTIEAIHGATQPKDGG